MQKHVNIPKKKKEERKKKRIGYQGGDDETLLVGNALAMPKNPVLVLEGRLGGHWSGLD